MTRPQVPTSQPQGPVTVPTTQAAPIPQPAPATHSGPLHGAHVAQPEPEHPVTQEPVAAPVGQQSPPPASEGLPDHLNFTANLDLRGLRADGEQSGEQNVGPTK
jgi:cell division transport system ATP-binding protein